MTIAYETPDGTCAGTSRKDLLGALRAYDALFSLLGFGVYLEPEEHTPSATGHICHVRVCSVDSPTGRLLLMGTGSTEEEAREDALRQAHEEYGLPAAFSEEEAKMRIALAGKDAFRGACGRIAAYVAAFGGRW